MRNFLLVILITLTAGCASSIIKMTDKYENGAYIKVPTHVRALEVNGRVVKTSLITDAITLEVPAGRTEFVYQFVNIFDTQHGDDHEEVKSSKMTVIFNAKEFNNYELVCQNPDSYEDAQKVVKNIKSHLLHFESGVKTQPVKGQIEERFHGIKIMEPYEELKHWWNKATQQEKNNFLKWTKDQ